jgi:hypothetical protein
MATRKQIGVRQRQMLADMARYGNGHWPEQWTMRADDRRIMRALFQRGLVTSEGSFATLTDAGQEALS